ncbi:MAG: hypothetical protein RL662_785 [Bacteroidota bacterium]|jgi:hypothetical protein
MNSIVIPIYKSTPSPFEEISFLQALCILGKKHAFSIVTHSKLNIDYYVDRLKEYKVSYTIEYFSSIYFSNITGYNFLMLSKDFYQRLERFNYILIYQLDCFVFHDELEYWTQKGYDYIGSPLFAHYMSYAEDRPFWYNGNGGFSLRKVDSFLRVLNWKYPLRKSSDIKILLEARKLSRSKYYIYYALLSIGFQNNINFFLKSLGYDPKTVNTSITDNQQRSNEDVIWSSKFLYTRVTIKTPNFDEGMGFSFEQSPEYLYQENKNKLPFGCHAWAKYNLSFWKPFIEKFGYKLQE